jgi:SAM-dependent methyltransferase
MFRKDPVAVEEWSTDNVQVCWQRQRRILADIWPALKPGGLLIYSTCTYNREEDEENVAWIADELGAEILKVPVASEWGIIGNLAGQDFPVYRFLPHRVKGEGLAAIGFLIFCMGLGQVLIAYTTTPHKKKKDDPFPPTRINQDENGVRSMKIENIELGRNKEAKETQNIKDNIDTHHNEE